MGAIARWHTPSRYYCATIQKTLLGLSVLTCWGSRRDGLGNWKETPVDSLEQGQALLNQIYKRRRQRRYVLVS
jgi:hypothetical protein